MTDPGWSITDIMHVIKVSYNKLYVYNIAGNPDCELLCGQIAHELFCFTQCISVCSVRVHKGKEEGRRR